MNASRALHDTVEDVKGVSRSDADADYHFIEKVKNGDVAAYNHLIRKYRERLYSVIYNLTSNREDAADLTQEAFIKAFKGIHKFRGQSSFFTWLYRIAVNATLSHLKKNRMRRFFSFETVHEEMKASEIVDALSVKSNLDRDTVVKELQEKLNEALQTLSIKHRTVVVLFEIEGLSHQEIADITKTSVGTVRSRLHYAKRELQAKLKNYL
ncbi:MAG: sigma-70 family RNA polymerase sigma factor [Opitutales bacterium]